MTSALLGSRLGRRTATSPQQAPAGRWPLADADPLPEHIQSSPTGTAREQAQWVIEREPHRIVGEWTKAGRWLDSQAVSPTSSELLIGWRRAYFDQLDGFVSLRGATALLLHFHT